MPRPLRPVRLIVAAHASLLVGCAPSTPTPAPPAAAEPTCVLVPAAGASGAPGVDLARSQVRVALSGPVHPANAPVPTNESERLLFRQLYRTLVAIDCEGRVEPGLAASWSHEGGGGSWRFTLRDGERFWDGSPVTAEAVARGWATAGIAVEVPPALRIESARVEGPLDLVVVLAEPTTAVETFAAPALAVRGAPTFGSWPLGTGPYHPLIAADVPPGEVRVTAGDAAGGVGTLVFGTEAGTDARSALDAGADVLISTDPAVIAYARALPDLVTVALPWSRTYVVAAAETEEGGTPSYPPKEALDGLARGAVRAEARSAEPPFWWRQGACRVDPRGPLGAEGPPFIHPPAAAPPSRIVYPLGDAVGRGIAERLVALAGLGPASPDWLVDAIPALGASQGETVVAGLGPAALTRAARASEALAFVAPVPAAPGGACLSELLAREDATTEALFAPDAGLRITPLVDVRATLVVRRGVGGITADGEGTPLFHPGGALP